MERGIHPSVQHSQANITIANGLLHVRKLSPYPRLVGAASANCPYALLVALSVGVEPQLIAHWPAEQLVPPGSEHTIAKLTAGLRAKQRLKMEKLPDEKLLVGLPVILAEFLTLIIPNSRGAIALVPGCKCILNASLVFNRRWFLCR